MKKIITQAILTKDMFCYDMKSLGERKLIFIESLSFYFLAFYICRKCDSPNVNFYLPTKKLFYRNLHYPIQERLSLLISKRVSYNFAEKLLAMPICFWCTLTCLCTVISRSLLRRGLFWCPHGWEKIKE